MLTNKQRVWIDQNRAFILQLAAFEDKNPGAVDLFHRIIKKQGAERAEVERSATDAVNH